MLFNRENKGSEELNRLVGTFYASNNFATIEGELVAAENELSHLVGPEVIRLARDKYSAYEDDDLVDAVRLPVALLAISRWSAQMDVSHEDSGRKKKLDDNEKMPFEWMIDRDDRAMRERYYRALDALYEHLEANNIEQWRKSPVRMLQEECIVRSLDDFEIVFPIEHSHYVFYLMASLMVETQRLEVRKLFGDRWQLVTSADPDKDLLSIARGLVVLSSVVKAVKRWSISVFPLEIARRFSPSYQGNRQTKAAETKEIDWYVDSLEKQIRGLKQEAHSLLGSASSDVRLLPENSRDRKFFTVV